MGWRLEGGQAAGLKIYAESRRSGSELDQGQGRTSSCGPGVSIVLVLGGPHSVNRVRHDQL